MWNQGGFDQGYGQTAGGFMNTTNQFSSPGSSQGERKPVRRAQNIVPVSIRQILDSTEESLKIGDTEVHMVTIVGLVRAVEQQTTKITYQIDDTNGVIEAVQWLEGDGGMNDANHQPVMENTYCRILGSVRTHQGKRHIMVFKIIPLKDLNELTTHILEVIHTNLKLQQLQEKQVMESAAYDGGMNSGLSNSMVGTSFGNDGNFSMGGGGGSMDGLNPQQQLVYKIIQSSADEVGIEKSQICSSLRGKLNPRDIDMIIEFLSGEGHIYSTVDDDHYRTTDS